MTDYRIVSYRPFGTRRGVIPAKVSAVVDLDLDDPSQLQLTQLTDAPRLDLLEPLEDGLEPHFRVQVRAGKGDVWRDPLNNVLVRIGRDRDEKQDRRVRTYRAIGLGHFLERTPAWDARDANGDPPEPGLGGTEQVAVFEGWAWGRIVNYLFQQAQAKGWFPALTCSLSATTDSAGVAYDPDKIPTDPVVIKCSESLAMVCDRARAERALEFGWNGYELKGWNNRTHLFRDVTRVGVGGAAVLLSTATAGITSQPEKYDPTNTVNSVTVLGEGGRRWPFDNGAAASPFGAPTFRTISDSGVTTEAQARRKANEVLAAGERPLEQITMVLDLRAAKKWQPLIDWEVGWKVEYDVGPNEGDPTRQRRRSADRVQHLRIELAGGEQKAFVTLRDKIPRPATVNARKARRDAAGAVTGVGGRAAAPQRDPRVPDAPTGIVVTPRVVHRGRGVSRTFFEVQIVAPETTHDTPDGSLEAITLDRVGLWYLGPGDAGYKRISAWDDIAAVVTVSNNGAGFDPGLHKFRAKSQAHDNGQWSPFATVVEVTQAADADPVSGTELILDAPFLSNVVAAARLADAGAGFAWGTAGGRRVAQFSSTTPVLNLAIDGQGGKSGRLQCAEADVLVLSSKLRHTGTGTGALRARARFFDQAGAAVGAALTAFTTSTTTSWVRTSGTVTVPADAVTAEVWLTASTRTGTAVIEAKDPGVARQAITERIGDGQILTPKIGLNQVTEERQADGSTSTRVLAGGAVTEPKHGTGSGSSRMLADLAVINAKVGGSAITEPKMAGDSVGTVELISGSHLTGTASTSSLGFGTAGSSKLTFNASGEIRASGGGIVTYDATNHQLDGNGNLNGAWTHSGSFGPVSSRSAKVDTGEITLEQAEALLSLDPFTYRYDPVQMKERLAVYEQVGPEEGAPEGTINRVRLGKLHDDSRHAGLAAEDVEATGVLDELLIRRDGDVVGLEMAQGWVYLIPALRDSRRELAEVREELAELRALLRDRPRDG